MTLPASQQYMLCRQESSAWSAGKSVFSGDVFQENRTGLVLKVHRSDDMSPGALARAAQENNGTHLQWAYGYLFL